MEKRALFSSRILPYALLLPQLAITFVFFYWPASQAVWQSFLLEDAFGLSSEFVGFENYRYLFRAARILPGGGHDGRVLDPRRRSCPCRSRSCSPRRPTSGSAAGRPSRRC